MLEEKIDVRNLDVICQNAERLLDDAEILFKLGRYPTAISLSILSIEESGKYTLLATDCRQNLRRGVLHHKHKQAVLGDFYWKWATYEVMLEEFLRFKEWLKEAGHTKEYKEIQQKDGAEAVDFMLWTRRRESPEKIEAFIRDNFQFSRQLDHLSKALKGEFEKIRQSGIYADVGSDGAIRNDPRKLARPDAEEWLEEAKVAHAFADMWKDMLHSDERSDIHTNI